MHDEGVSVNRFAVPCICAKKTKNRPKWSSTPCVNSIHYDTTSRYNSHSAKLSSPIDLGPGPFLYPHRIFPRFVSGQLFHLHSRPHRLTKDPNHRYMKHSGQSDFGYILQRLVLLVDVLRPSLVSILSLLARALPSQLPAAACRFYCSCPTWNTANG